MKKSYILNVLFLVCAHLPLFGVPRNLMRNGAVVAVLEMDDLDIFSQDSYQAILNREHNLRIVRVAWLDDQNRERFSHYEANQFAVHQNQPNGAQDPVSRQNYIRVELFEVAQDQQGQNIFRFIEQAQAAQVLEQAAQDQANQAAAQREARNRADEQAYNQKLRQQGFILKALIHAFDVNSCFSSFEEKSLYSEVMFILQHFDELEAFGNDVVKLENFIRTHLQGFSNGDILTRCFYLNLKQLPSFVRYTHYYCVFRANGPVAVPPALLRGGIRHPGEGELAHWWLARDERAIFPISVEMLFDSVGLAAFFKVLDRRASALARTFIENKDAIKSIVADYKKALASSDDFACESDEIGIDLAKDDCAQILLPSYKSFRTEIKEVFTKFTVGSKLTALGVKAAFALAGVYAAEYIQRRLAVQVP
jgi:hypothetical protein